MKLNVGTRGSRLSLIQTGMVIQKLRKVYPDLQVEIKVIKTKGDRVTRKPLNLIEGSGVFEKEIDQAVLRREVDFAVHSMKDVPTIHSPRIVIAAVPERDLPYDALVSKGAVKLSELPEGAVVGTSSPRREAQLHHVRPDLKAKSIRGNVDTRLRKLRHGLYDAIILAEAGLRRLNLEGYIAERLSLEEFTPAPGQGALALVARKESEDVISILKNVNHPPSMAETIAEREFLRRIGGGCRTPVGAIARAHVDILSLYVSILSSDGKMKIQTSQTGDILHPEALGVSATQKLLKFRAKELIRYRGT